MPGGCEALVHWRALMEEQAMSGRMPPVIAFDLDLANMFGTVERDRIREALRQHFPEALPWTQWVHSDTEVLDLPQGGEACTDRGSGQGDVFAPAASALALGDSVCAARADLRSGQQRDRIGAVDEWFIDDGQALVLVEAAERWLRRIDQAIDGIGCSRDHGPNCKSVARLLCHPDRRAEFHGWETGLHLSDMQGVGRKRWRQGLWGHGWMLRRGQ